MNKRKSMNPEGSLLWKCPFCGKSTVIGKNSYTSTDIMLRAPNRHGPLRLHVLWGVCPKCKEFALMERMYSAKKVAIRSWKDKIFAELPIRDWDLIPGDNGNPIERMKGSEAKSKERKKRRLVEKKKEGKKRRK